VTYDRWGQIPRQYDPALHEQRLMELLPASPEEAEPWLPPRPVDPPHPPTARRAGRSRPARHKVLAALGSAVAVVVIATAAASHPAKPSAAAPSAAVATASNCPAQADNWYSGGGGQLINTFSSDFAAFSTAGENFVDDLQAGNPTMGDVSAVQSAASAIQSDAQDLAASPGPACVPGLNSAITAAARDYSAAATDVREGMDLYSSGSLNAATGDIEAATAAMSKGNAQIAVATTAVTNLRAR
jgi:hypothetical protein